MSSLDFFKITSSVLWRQLDEQNNVIVLEDAKLNLVNKFTDGTGSDQLNKVFFDASTLSSGQIFKFDLFSLRRSIFGEAFTINFSGNNVKVLYIENLSTGIGQDLFVCATGTGGFSQLLGYSYLGFMIKPATHSIFYDSYSGFPITTGERYLYLQNLQYSGGIDYQIGIFGANLG